MSINRTVLSKIYASHTCGSAKLNYWNASLVLHALIICLIFYLSSKKPLTSVLENNAAIELVYTTAKVDFQIIENLLERKQQKIVGSFQKLANKDSSLNYELLKNNKSSSMPDVLSASPDLPLIAKQTFVSSQKEYEQQKILIIDRQKTAINKGITSYDEFRPIKNGGNLARLPQNKRQNVQAPPIETSSPIRYKGDILGASSRSIETKIPGRQDGFSSHTLKTCSSKGKNEDKKNQIKQIEENKHITISALLGGSFVYQTIRKQQQVNISALLGGGVGQRNTPKVEELLNLYSEVSTELDCGNQ